MNDCHECSPLLAAFREQNKQIENFLFLIHKAGFEWEDKNVRLDYEAKLIAENKHRCYNIQMEDKKKSFPMVRKPLMYNGTRYESTRDAARALNLARASVCRHLASENFPNVYYIETQSYGFCPIFAQSEKGFSVLFSSMGECVEANYATNVQNARRKIKRGEIGWRYAHFDPQTNKPLRIPYTLKPGEITYDQYCDICSYVFCVNFIFTSIQ